MTGVSSPPAPHQRENRQVLIYSSQPDTGRLEGDTMFSWLNEAVHRATQERVAALEKRADEMVCEFWDHVQEERNTKAYHFSR